MGSKSNGNETSSRPAVTEYRIKDTGIVLQIRKVSPYLGQEISRVFPAPKPPINRVNFGTEDNPEWHEEENQADPAYAEAYRRYQEELEQRIRKAMIRLGVVLELDEEQKAQVRELRETMKEFGVELDPDDKFIFVSMIAVGTPEDISELLTVISRRSQPDNKGVEAALDQFPG